MPKRTGLCKVQNVDKTPFPDPDSENEFESPLVTPYQLPTPPLQKKAQKEPSRPILEPHKPGCEYPTLTKAKVQAVFEYLPHISIQPNAEHIFEVFNIKRTQGY
jgi:hypothetical protein